MELQAFLGSWMILTEGNREEARIALTRALELAEKLRLVFSDAAAPQSA